MAIIRLFERKQTYSDVEFVDGVYRKDRRCQNALYDYCRSYFDNHYKRVFFIDKNKSIQPYDIFQEAFYQLWWNIENRLIYVEDGKLYGRKGKHFTGKLTTYFMSIAKFKNLEISRQSFSEILEDDDFFRQLFEDLSKQLANDEEDEIFKTMKLEILAECMSQMPKRCFEIFTKFYYEEKSLREIMVELDIEVTDKRYMAFIQEKYRCENNLRDSANTMWQGYLGRGELVKTKKTKNKKNE